jgi:serine protease
VLQQVQTWGKLRIMGSFRHRRRLLVAVACCAMATSGWAASALGAGSFIPNDPGTGNAPGGWTADQWSFLGGPGGVRAPAAWARLGAPWTEPGHGVTVAVLDSGVAYRSDGAARRDPDLVGVRFVAPRDFVDGDHEPSDVNGHGTHLAATIAEATNNGLGLTGLAYGASVMPIRVLDSHLRGSASTLARGIRYAWRHGADVINLSLTFGPTIRRCAQIASVCKAIAAATRHGSLVIAAAGNNAAATPAMPAAAPKAVSVGATTLRGCLADYSDRGADLVAPGGGGDADIPGDARCDTTATKDPGITEYSLKPGGDLATAPSFDYVELMGTSQAAAEASAVAALVISSGVHLDHRGPRGVAHRLACTARPTGHRAYFGRHGEVDAARAVDPNVRC